MRTRVYNPDAQVQVVDGRNEPAFLNLTTAEIRQYLRDKYMDREVAIDSDGTPVLFTGKGLNSSLKKRGKHKRVLHVLDNLVKNSHYTRFEPNDGQDKHKALVGQFVYTAAIRLADGVYGVELKLDIPKSDPGKTRFKGQTLKTKIADAVLSVRRADGVERTSTNEASAKETVRLGDIVSTPQIIPQGGVATQEGHTFFAVSARRPDLVGVHNISAEGLKGAIDLSGMRYSITTEAAVADKIRAWADTPEAAGLGWTKATVEEVLEETQKLLNAVHASVSGDINYDEWVKRIPTLRVDWRDGEKKPVVTWSRGNIEYKYDMSADTLCINNEGLETILSSPVMADLMIHMAGFSVNDHALNNEECALKTPSFKLTFLKELCDNTSNWPGSITEAFLPGRGLDGLGDFIQFL